MIPCRWFFVFVTLLCSFSHARSDDLKLDLSVKAGMVTRTPEAQIAALGVKAKPRGTLEAAPGKTLNVKYTIASTAAALSVKDVTIHFYVVKIDKVGQATIPKLDKEVAAESAFTMDFKPKEKAGGEMSFAIDTPGVYLLRLETIGAARGVDGHEHFAALDLVIKGEAP
jgi:hypothetical protein